MVSRMGWIVDESIRSRGSDGRDVGSQPLDGMDHGHVSEGPRVRGSGGRAMGLDGGSGSNGASHGKGREARSHAVTGSRATQNQRNTEFH